MTTEHRARSRTGRNRALFFYGAAMLAVALGIVLAARRFPGEFDWVYMVFSKLASAEHNPDGGTWLGASLLVAACLLWPVAAHLARPAARGRCASPRISVAALRIGILGIASLGLEGLLPLDFDAFGRKGHEVVALATFLGLYGGVLGLYTHRIRHLEASPWPPLLVLLPLVAVGLSQVALYFDQRDLGWVNVAWRDLGVPFWLSFAFWQWLAVAGLLGGLGYLVVAREAVFSRKDARPTRWPTS